MAFKKALLFGFAVTCFGYGITHAIDGNGIMAGICSMISGLAVFAGLLRR